MIANSGIILDPLQAGERSNGEGKAVKNRILLTLPDHLYRQVRTHLEFLELPHHLVLHEPNRKLEFAYFPNSGMISLVVVTKNEKTLEVGIGRERRNDGNSRGRRNTVQPTQGNRADRRDKVCGCRSRWCKTC